MRRAGAMRYAANISLLFTEWPFGDRFGAAAAAGFDGVEILFPYDHDPGALRDRIDAAGLDLVLINAPPPHPDRDQAGFAATPGGEDRFRAAMERVLAVARVLRPGRIHVMAGYCSGDDAFATFTANLRWLADRAPGQGLSIEPLNRGDQPGYFLNDYALAARVLDAVDRPNVGLQFDSYHAQAIHGDAPAVWERYRDRICHVQVGDAPGRCEPGAGGVDFAALFAAMGAQGYAGWISAEYTPTTARTEDSLAWMRQVPAGPPRRAKT